MSKFLRIVTVAVAAGLIVAGLAGCSSPEQRQEIRQDKRIEDRTEERIEGRKERRG